MRSGRFLSRDHFWRNNAKAFDDNEEKQFAPRLLSGDDVIEQYQQFDQPCVY